jgi:hypothetical protein
MERPSGAGGVALGAIDAAWPLLHRYANTPVVNTPLRPMPELGTAILAARRTDEGVVIGFQPDQMHLAPAATLFAYGLRACVQFYMLHLTRMSGPLPEGYVPWFEGVPLAMQCAVWANLVRSGHERAVLRKIDMDADDGDQFDEDLAGVLAVLRHANVIRDLGLSSLGSGDLLALPAARREAVEERAARYLEDAARRRRANVSQARGFLAGIRALGGGVKPERLSTRRYTLAQLKRLA